MSRLRISIDGVKRPLLLDTPDLSDLAFSASAKMGKQVAEIEDAIIRRALDRRLGQNWALDELKGRLHMVASTAQPRHRHFFLDGKLLVALVGPEISCADRRISATIRFREQKD
jgi:hypothetical protein